MLITASSIQEGNASYEKLHQRKLDALSEDLERQGLEVENIIKALQAFQVAIPSWALGRGGTRFGRFQIGGEPRNLEEKLMDVGLLHQLTQTAGAISLHIPWDIPEDIVAIQQIAQNNHLVFDAVNSNTFQDQSTQEHSYQYGSLSHTKEAVRTQAIEHNLEVIKYGEALGSKALTVWLADGSNFPGQQNLRKALDRTQHSLETIYQSLPQDWQLLIEYKPYEPNFYSMVIPDWGTSFLLANQLGDKAKTLVDLGHHLPNTNIEQIVATLTWQQKLGGFHFNDSSYGDDDLSVGSAKPYQLFLIFNELLEDWDFSQALAWMIDASHNIKDPLEDLIQSLEAIQIAFAKAQVIDRKALHEAQENNETTLAQELLQDAFLTDVRPLVAEARRREKGAIYPLKLYQDLKIREKLIQQRGFHQASGL